MPVPRMRLSAPEKMSGCGLCCAVAAAYLSGAMTHTLYDLPTDGHATQRPDEAPEAAPSAHAFGFDLNDARRLELADCAGGPVLVVNTASRCGFTPQYEGLVRLNHRYGRQGLTVIGVPTNDFANQEPGDDAAIRFFCQSSYDVDFPIAAKTHVLGPDAHPFYRWVRARAGFLGRRPWWNFHKYLIGPNGEFVDWFSPFMKPEDRGLVSRIETVLPAQAAA